MVIKVPTPAEQGAQNIGGIGVTRKVSTPFQSFSVPVLDAGARNLKEIGGAVSSGLGKLASEHEAAVGRNDKRALLEFDAAEKSLQQELLFDPTNGLGSKAGAEALERINGKGFGADLEDTAAQDSATAGIIAEYKSRLEALRSTAASQLSEEGKASLDISSENSLTSITGTVNKAEIAAQAKVDLDLVTGRIASAAEGAAGAVGAAGSDNTALAGAIGSSLNAIEAAVRDKDIGLAAQKGITDPGLIDAMVKQQQALVYKRVIETMVAKGDTVGAMTLLDNQTQPGGTLRGTPEAVALQTSVLATRQSMQGKQIFNAIRVKHPTDAAAQLTEIYNIKNVNQQSLALAEWKAQTAAANVVKRENVANETLALVTFMQQNPGKPVDPRQYPALSQFSPRLVFEAGARVRGVATTTMMDAATAAHVAAGGSAVGNSTVVDNMSRLAKNDPAAFIKLMDKPENIKIFANASQWVQLQAKEITARQAELDATSGPVKYDSVLKGMGFKASSSRYKSLIQNPELHTALNDARRRIFDQTGKAATLDDLTPVVAKFALPVDASFETKPTLYHLSEYAKEGTVDSKTMGDTPLDVDNDRDLTPLHYAFDRQVSAAELRVIIDEIDGPVTLNIIAAKIKGGADHLKLGQWEQDRTDFHNAVLGMGYPPAFMAAILDIQNERKGLPHTEANANAVAAQLRLQPEVYKKQFEKWAAGGAL